MSRIPTTYYAHTYNLRIPQLYLFSNQKATNKQQLLLLLLHYVLQYYYGLLPMVDDLPVDHLPLALVPISGILGFGQHLIEDGASTSGLIHLRVSRRHDGRRGQLGRQLGSQHLK